MQLMIINQRGKEIILIIEMNQTKNCTSHLLKLQHHSLNQIIVQTQSKSRKEVSINNNNINKVDVDDDIENQKHIIKEMSS